MRVLLLSLEPVTRTLAKFGDLTTSGAEGTAISRRKKNEEQRAQANLPYIRIQRLSAGGEILHIHTHAPL